MKMFVKLISDDMLQNKIYINKTVQQLQDITIIYTQQKNVFRFISQTEIYNEFKSSIVNCQSEEQTKYSRAKLFLLFYQWRKKKLSRKS